MSNQWYSLILNDDDYSERCFEADDYDLFDFDYFELEYGNRIHSWNSNSSLRSTHRKYDGIPNDVLSECLNIPTLSLRLRTALERAKVGKKDIQYLPVHVYKSTGEEIKGYAFANVITRIPALDYTKTDWGPLGLDETEIDPETGKATVNGIWQAALKSTKLKGHDIVRLVEFFPPVFVSERFAEVYNKGKFTGATLTPVIMT